MKPETLFKRSIKRFLTEKGIVVDSVNEYMSGLDSRTRKAWRTFSVNLNQDSLPSTDVLQELESINNGTYVGRHALTDLAFQVDMAVRFINTAAGKFTFFNGSLTKVS